MREEMRISFTHQELFSFTEKILDSVASDTCPSCQVALDWRDCYSEEDIKTKIEEITKEVK